MDKYLPHAPRSARPISNDSDKSWVGMEQHVCPICGAVFDTGALLLDKRMRKTFGHKNITGYGLCPEHNKLYADGFTAMVGCDPDKSERLENGRIRAEQASRTGAVMHIRRTVWPQLFGEPAPTDAEGEPLAMVFCDQALIDQLQAMQAQAHGD